MDIVTLSGGLNALPTAGGPENLLTAAGSDTLLAEQGSREVFVDNASHALVARDVPKPASSALVLGVPVRAWRDGVYPIVVTASKDKVVYPVADSTGGFTPGLWVAAIP